MTEPQYRYLRRLLLDIRIADGGARHGQDIRLDLPPDLTGKLVELQRLAEYIESRTCELLQSAPDSFRR